MVLDKNDHVHLLEVLINCKIPVVNCDDNLRNTLEISGLCRNIATPQFVRFQLAKFFKQSNDSILNISICRFLLTYLLKG